MLTSFLKRAMAAALALAGTNAYCAETTTTAQNAGSIYSIPVEPMKASGGAQDKTLAPYKGKVMLIVNVASKCGYTPQYKGLEELHQKYKDKGLAVLGFPSNDFKQQEPGSEDEILQFCKTTYNVTFPIFAKVVVKGADKAPLYKYLTEGEHKGKAEVGWNFNKWLIGKDGTVIAHYDSKMKPDDAALTQAIEDALAK
jgi:glutathione peroxidase